jgi:hypothetical protein
LLTDGPGGYDDARVTPVDPWYDSLAFPIAPLLLLAQIVALFTRDRRIRLGVGLLATVAITAMLVYVATLDLAPAEGANIGAGVLSLALLVSLALLPLAGIQELVNSIRNRRG